MDQAIQQKVDGVTEDEVRRGYVVKELPTELVNSLRESHTDDATIIAFERARFTKLTPRKKRLINEVVVKRYHADLKNPDLLSNEQLRKLNIERGEWSVEKEERIKKLNEESGAKMRDLYFDGMDRRDAWTAELLEAAAMFRKSLVERPEGAPLLSEARRAEIVAQFERWMTFVPERQAEYDTKYATDQVLERYSPDRDMQALIDVCDTADAADAINDIEDLRDKIRRYVDVLMLRQELVGLQSQQARMFAESVESRRDTAEEMARLYYLTEVLDANGIPRGAKVDDARLASTFDRMWDLPDQLIQWLLVEMYFFLNGVPDEAREYLQEWGFIRAPQGSGSSDQPDGSPAEPSAKPAGPAAPVTPAVSSGSATATS